MQTTVRTRVAFRGTGLHSGRPARMTLKPARAGHGVVFYRSDIGGPDSVIPARWDLVEISPLCTKLVNAAGVSISTVEHLMAALAGLGLHNVRIEIDGPEVPILDGSAAPFVRAIMHGGLRVLEAPIQAIQILRPIEVRRDDAMARLDVASELSIDFSIDFDNAAIGRQERVLNMRNGAFVRTLCDSRTFCLQTDVDRMQANGLALGGTYHNAVVFDGDRVLSPGGLRHADEPVRHKMLDALGDLALAGAPILGRYTGVRAGHALTNQLLRALFADRSAWRLVDCDPSQARGLPGAGVTHHDLALCAA
ncbi:MAG: UDP-3-O-acyl-N-acetylglucosamine deacetylase [Qingshengfaniella sp.]